VGEGAVCKEKRKREGKKRGAGVTSDAVVAGNLQNAVCAKELAGFADNNKGGSWWRG